MRDKIKNATDVFTIVTEMNSYSDVFMALRNADDELWHGENEISDNIRLLILFGLKQPYSLLMAAYKSLDTRDFNKLLKDIIVISFRYSVICGKNPNDIERVYNNIAIQITTEKIYDKKRLKEVYIDDNEFVPIFSRKSFVDNSRNNKIIRYILGKIEKFSGGTREVNIDGNTDTIEHILPQNPDETWGEDYNFDNLIYRMGNLCLLEKVYNNELKNKPYADKVILYNVWPHSKVKNFHRKHARHHVENTIRKTEADYIEMIIDWECARYTKPDKPLNAYDTLYKFYPQLEDKVLPLLKKFNLDYHTEKL